TEAHVLEADPLLVRGGQGQGQGQGRGGRGREREVVEEVRHVEDGLVDRRDRAEDRLERLLALAEGDEVEGHAPERDRSARGGERDRGVAAVEGPRRDERERRPDERALDREPAI